MTQSEKLSNLPNLLTLSRILLIPLFVIVYAIPGEATYIYAAALFALATTILLVCIPRSLSRSMKAELIVACV